MKRSAGFPSFLMLLGVICMVTKPKVLIHVAIEKHLTKKIEKVAVVDELAVTAPREELLHAHEMLKVYY